MAISSAVSAKTDLCIKVDSNESSPELIQDLERCGFKVQIDSLPVDFFIPENVWVERKVFPSDFLASVTDGRLQAQLAILREAKLGVLLLEGALVLDSSGYILNGVRRTGFNLVQVSNLILSAQVSGVSVLWSPNSRWTPMVLAGVAKWSEKRIHNALVKRPSGQWSWPHGSSFERGLFFLQGLGVEPQTAEKLWRHFGSISSVITASLEDLKSVPGIGEKKALKIRSLLEMQYPVLAKKDS